MVAKEGNVGSNSGSGLKCEVVPDETLGCCDSVITWKSETAEIYYSCPKGASGLQMAEK